ncbi:hypothetical protein, partial [Paenibacillus elgii]|uniref:hypothetical protein n=1 Tax=Paenibacillus elgii TaxID=189691 RepID=UPI0013E36953
EEAYEKRIIRCLWAGRCQRFLFACKDDFDWQQDEIKKVNLIEIVEEKEQNGEIIGVTLIWGESGVGGDFLLNPQNK